MYSNNLTQSINKSNHITFQQITNPPNDKNITIADNYEPLIRITQEFPNCDNTKEISKTYKRCF